MGKQSKNFNHKLLRYSLMFGILQRCFHPCSSCCCSDESYIHSIIFRDIHTEHFECQAEKSIPLYKNFLEGKVLLTVCNIAEHGTAEELGQCLKSFPPSVIAIEVQRRSSYFLAKLHALMGDYH